MTAALAAKAQILRSKISAFAPDYKEKIKYEIQQKSNTWRNPFRR